VANKFEIKYLQHDSDYDKKEFEDTKGAIRIHISKKNRLTQWPKEKVQKDKQRSTKHTYKTKDRVTQTPLKTGSELRCSGRVSSSCSTSDTCHVNLDTNLVIIDLQQKLFIVGSSCTQ
jgi:hypothetical protein